MHAVKYLLTCLLRSIVRLRTDVWVGPSSEVRWSGLLRTQRGRVRIGSKSLINCKFLFDHPAGRISIGDRCFIGASTLVCHTGISIEDDVIISWGVTVVDHDSHSIDWIHRASDVSDWTQGHKDWTHVSVMPVKICRKVWIGFGASILKGVEIGEGAVVGACSVVTRDVPPWTVVAGNPARVVRSLSPSNKNNHES